MMALPAYSQLINVPYMCGFEDSVEVSNWVLNYGADGPNCKEQWVVGNGARSEGRNGLYISNDGYSAAYGVNSNIVVAYREFSVSEHIPYDISFDWRSMGKLGESDLYVLLLRESDPVPESNSASGVATNVIQARSLARLNGSSRWQNHELRQGGGMVPGISLGTGEKYKLAFVWVNNNRDSVNIGKAGACIDNIQIVPTGCLKPSNLQVDATCDTTVITWSGSSAEYEVEYKSMSGLTWNKLGVQTAKRYEMYGLSEGAYAFRVRGICHGTDEWGDVVTDTSAYVTANAVTVFYGSSISVSKGSVEKELEESELARVNGTAIQGILCFQVTGTEDLLFGHIYWYLAAVGGLILAGFIWSVRRKYKKGLSSPTLRFLDAIRRYGFLMEQLVNRDFKAKYKRSVLGILWSFLNPLLMMMVQYVVFSTLFQSNIPNFPLYLLTGIVCFNFFNESTNMCLQSISGNAGLITKVYVPKYIYPVTRVLSSSINLMLSLIPLLLVMLITRTPIRPQVLLIVFGIFCLEIFCLGMGLILASLMVFFRDTQFIWGVLVTILNFATPIFYPESIIPARFMTLYKMNPLDHVIRFLRIVLMDGVSPEPKAYLLCLIACVVPLVLGVVVFKKNQDKFILYI